MECFEIFTIWSDLKRNLEQHFKTFQILKILILRIILRKLQNSKKNSKNKTILRIRILVNTGHGFSQQKKNTEKLM